MNVTAEEVQKPAVKRILEAAEGRAVRSVVLEHPGAKRCRKKSSNWSRRPARSRAFPNTSEQKRFCSSPKTQLQQTQHYRPRVIGFRNTG